MRTSSTLLRMVPLALGLIGIAVAITMGAVAGHFMTWHFAMGGLSILSIIGSLLWINDVRWKETLSSFVYTLFFFLCLALVYMISANRQVRWDLTLDRVHTLSPLTSAVLYRAAPDEIILLQIFAPAPEHAAFERFLQTYAREAPQLRYELYDPARDLDVVARFGGGIEPGRMFLTLIPPAESNEEPRRTDARINIGDTMRENTLTNALARLLHENQKVIYWSIGNGEKPVDDTEDSLTKVAQYVVDATLPIQPLRLNEGRTPDDAAMIIIAGPRRDLSAFERDLLIHYMDEGGKLFLLLDPIFGDRVILENFESLAAHVGVTAPNSYVVDPLAMNVQQVALSPQALWATHEISDATNRVPFYLDGARPLESYGEIAEGIRLEGVLVSHEQTWAEPATALRSLRTPVPPDDPEEIHSHVLALTAMKETRGGRHGNMMRAVIIGNSGAFSDANIDRNGDAALFFIQSVNWLREQQDLLQVPPRFLTSTPINLTVTRLWILIGVLGFIGLAITLGGTAWTIVRRRVK